jgi:hypothetical protein
VRGTHLRANRGAAILVHQGATPRITHNLIVRGDPRATDSKAIEIQSDAKPVLVGNVISGFGANPVVGLQNDERDQMMKRNLLIPETSVKTPPPMTSTIKPKGEL